MKYANIMEEIKSTRDYKDMKVKKDTLDEIILSGHNALENHNLEILLYEDGEKTKQKLEGKAGYYGKFISAPHYIAVVGHNCNKDLENAAYIIEMMRFKAHENGLGSCWISIPDGEDIKKDLNINISDDLCGFFAIGYRYAGIFKTDIQHKSYRQGAIEITYIEEWGNSPTWNDLEVRGLDNVFYLTRFAPSWGNKQPWRFLVLKDTVVLTIEKNEKLDIELDTGIIKFYFEKACVDSGFQVKSTEIDVLGLNIPDDYEIKAIYKI